MRHLTELGAELDAVPGTVSVWFGRPGSPPAYARAADATHYAASTVKLAVLAALYREHDAGLVDLDEPTQVRNEFASAAAGGGVFACRQRYDNDEAVWRRLGSRVPLRWLAQRMIVRSSNLAANLVLSRIGIESAAEVWRTVGARHSIVARPIEDQVAADAGIANLVTAADLATLLGAIAFGADGTAGAGGGLASPASCRAMLDTLFAQECTEDLAAGLPAGTRVAHKNGWVMGIRHAAGIVFPDDGEPFVLTVCLSTPLAINRRTDEACQLVARLAAAAWRDRHCAGCSAR